MSLRVSKVSNKSGVNYYIIEDYYNENGKRSTRTVEKLGTYDSLIYDNPNVLPDDFAASRLKELQIEKQDEIDNELADISKESNINMSSVFLLPIYNSLGLSKVCDEITKKHSFKYDLNSILSDLVINRILSPSSKKSTFDDREKHFNHGSYSLDDVYRSLSILSKESDYIQEVMYKKSVNITNRVDRVLYYDCTNYYFEIDQEDKKISETGEVTKGLRTYGKEKNGMKKPIVQMGLFMDGDGIPLAYNITSGCTNEQITLIPSLKKIINNYGLEKFIVCTDAGLSSAKNRDFDSRCGRSFITTIPPKSLKKHEEWAMNPTEWRISGKKDDKRYDISKLIELAKDDPDSAKCHKHYNTVFYKKAPVDHNSIASEQFYIVTFCLKYAAMKRKSIDQLIKIAEALVKNPDQPKAILKKEIKKLVNQHVSDAETGELKINQDVTYSINATAVNELSKYHGFYVVATNLDEEIENIVEITKRRWEIEETFRIMKTNFRSRPVFLSTEEGIKGHFLICYIAITIYRLLEKILENKYTTEEILSTLRNLTMYKNELNIYKPTFKETEVYNDLTEKFGYKIHYKRNSEEKLKQHCRSKKFIKIHKEMLFNKRKNRVK